MTGHHVDSITVAAFLRWPYEERTGLAWLCLLGERHF
jgi:hypothetical protein